MQPDISSIPDVADVLAGIMRCVRNTDSVKAPADPSAQMRALAGLDGRGLWVVGGAVRDWALGRPPKDLDLAAEGDVSEAGLAVAEATGGHFFMLHPVSHTARVALSPASWIDLVPLPHGLEADLRRRDFTVNAMAAPLDRFARVLAEGSYPTAGAPPAWIADPTGGWEDLHSGVLRMTHAEAFDEDPLRAMRALRLAITLAERAGRSFNIEAPTADAVRRHTGDLVSVSAERVRDEWMLMMDSRHASDALDLAAGYGLLDILVPEWRDMPSVTQNPYHHLDVWEHTLDVMRQFDALQDPATDETLRLPEDLLEPMREYLDECPTPPHTRRSLLRTAILLHDTGKPATRTEDEDGRIRFFGHERTSEDIARGWASRWKLSGRERDYVAAVVGLHMRPGSLMGQQVTPRAVHRFFRDAGMAAPALLLLNAADRMAARGPWTTDNEVREQAEGSWRILRTWLEMKDTVALPLPVSGRDLMTAFSIPPGPEVGRLIQVLREAHSETPFPDREAALEAAAGWMHEAV